MEIIRIQSDEVGVVSDLAEKIWPDTFKDILTEEQIRYMLDWMYNPTELIGQIQNGHQFYLLKMDQKPLGFIGVQVNYPEPTQLKIHKLYVLPEVQGTGGGKLLFQQAVQVAKENKCDSILLNVNRFNKAVGFYKHIGFEILKEENIDIGNGFWMEDYVMGCHAE
jgi:GNAT superfamily N-acetyltransferase